MNFVACPVVRDTKTVPCFLAEYQGETYFLGIQQDIAADFYPPQLLHEALVEGRVAPGPRVCGGIPLKPLHVSVLPELNRACNTILPAEPESTPRRPSAPPDRPRVRLPCPRHPCRPRSQSLHSWSSEFTIQYDFDSDFLFARNTRQLTDIAEYARVSQANEIHVTGYRGSTLLSNGTELSKKAMSLTCALSA